MSQHSSSLSRSHSSAASWPSSSRTNLTPRLVGGMVVDRERVAKDWASRSLKFGLRVMSQHSSSLSRSHNSSAGSSPPSTRANLTPRLVCGMVADRERYASRSRTLFAVTSLLASSQSRLIVASSIAPSFLRVSSALESYPPSFLFGRNDGAVDDCRVLRLLARYLSRSSNLLFSLVLYMFLPAPPPPPSPPE